MSRPGVTYRAARRNVFREQHRLHPHITWTSVREYFLKFWTAPRKTRTNAKPR